MEEYLGHKISDKSIQLAQEHTKESSQHGKSVENVGKALSADGASIAEQGRAIQEQLESGQAHHQELQQTRSTEAFGKVVENHVQASQAHVEANKEYLALSQGKATLLQQGVSHGSARDLYEKLLALSHQALTRELYETAFHALTAAFHAAEALEDEQRLLAVELAAKAQQEWINTHTPQHRMSTQSTIQRKGTSLYGSLTRQAETHVLLVKQKRQREQTQPLPWPGDVRE